MLFANFVSSQTEDSVIKVMPLDASTKAAMEEVISSSKPTDPDFWIIDDDFLKSLMKNFTYDEETFRPFKKTIYYYPNEENESIVDSLLFVENLPDKYTFIKSGADWRIQNFTMLSSPVSIRNISVGMNSKRVFEILKKKTNKKVGDGQVWISQKDGKAHIELSFEKDKIVMMRL